MASALHPRDHPTGIASDTRIPTSVLQSRFPDQQMCYLGFASLCVMTRAGHARHVLSESAEAPVIVGDDLMFSVAIRAVVWAVLLCGVVVSILTLRKNTLVGILGTIGFLGYLLADVFAKSLFMMELHQLMPPGCCMVSGMALLGGMVVASATIGRDAGEEDA